MAVVNDGDVFDLRNQIVGQQRVEVVGKEQVGAATQQHKEKPDIETGVKQRPPFKEQSHAVHGIRPRRQWQAASSPASHQQHLVAQLLKYQAALVDTLVGDEIVDNRNDGFFQSGIITFSICENSYFVGVMQMNSYSLQRQGMLSKIHTG